MSERGERGEPIEQSSVNTLPHCCTGSLSSFRSSDEAKRLVWRVGVERRGGEEKERNLEELVVEQRKVALLQYRRLITLHSSFLRSRGKKAEGRGVHGAFEFLFLGQHKESLPEP